MNTFTNPTSSFILLGRGFSKTYTVVVAERSTKAIHDEVYAHLRDFFGDDIEPDRAQLQMLFSKAQLITTKLLNDEPVQVSL